MIQGPIPDQLYQNLWEWGPCPRVSLKMPQVVLCAVRTTALIFRHFFQYFIQPRIICSKACLSKRKQEPFQVALRSLYAHKKSHPAWVLETQAQLTLGDFYGNKRICPKPSFYFAFVLTIFLFQLKKKNTSFYWGTPSVQQDGFLCMYTPV